MKFICLIGSDIGTKHVLRFLGKSAGADGALGAYLVHHRAVEVTEPTTYIVSEQGAEISRPSTIYVEVDGQSEEIAAVRVGERSCL